MLNNLYRKLHILFTGSVMLIITFVLLIVIVNTVYTERINESTFFQRMSTLLIYQIERDSSTVDTSLKNYEDSYHIFSLLTDMDGETIYQSNFSLPSSADLLFMKVQKQMAQNTLFPSDTGTTSQSGIFELKGAGKDTYLGIPATIVTSNDTTYEALFLYQIDSLNTILQRVLPLYLLIWFFAFIVVLFFARFLIKKVLVPTERIWKSQKEFVATASHELKSPLAVMISHTDLLLADYSLNEQSRQSVWAIDIECMRLSRLVKDMLLLASSDAKSWTLYPSEINIDTLLITLYETYETTCLKNKIDLKLNLSDESYPAMFTDKDRLFQILCIFMDNAIQHAKNNALIEILLTHNGRSIAFSVKDHGRGISDTDKHYIFDRFYSGDKSHTNKSNFGLGLSIAKELAQMLGGGISVKDTPGGGATFTVKFDKKNTCKEPLCLF